MNSEARWTFHASTRGSIFLRGRLTLDYGCPKFLESDLLVSTGHLSDYVTGFHFRSKRPCPLCVRFPSTGSVSSTTFVATLKQSLFQLGNTKNSAVVLSSGCKERARVRDPEDPRPALCSESSAAGN